MAKFLIELPHKAEPQACANAIKVLLSTGSHFLTNADFGCLDGEHKAWMIVELEDKAHARSILPPAYREDAKIVQLNRFTLQQIDDMLRSHEKDNAAGHY